MNLKSYMNLYQLLQHRESSHEQNRAFGLKHQDIAPIMQLLLWQEKHLTVLKRPLLSERFASYLYGISLMLGILALLLGVFSGMALLSYSGHEPVNMVYFMAMVVFVPLFTMSLSLLSMFRADSARSVLIHLSPAFWMEKVIGFLPGKRQQQLEELRINPLLLNWLVIQRAQMLALLFSIGLLLALLGIVATKDIAFAWSTTLQVTPETFHQFLSASALPWREWFPSAVPSIELIEQSQYFRLGEKLDSGMVANAAKLGEWWKFLASATLFYAIILRFGMWLLSLFGFNRALKKSLLSLEGTERLLYEMNSPLVTTTAPKQELVFVGGKGQYSRVLSTPEARYSVALGWAMTKRGITVLNDSMQVRTEDTFDIGGTNTLNEDQEIISGLQGEVLLYVKSWEPPTMDLMDALSEIIAHVDKITLLPVGTQIDRYAPTSRELNIWERKLQQLNHPKVWLCRIN
jgi:hypothetical protein